MQVQIFFQLSLYSTIIICVCLAILLGSYFAIVVLEFDVVCKRYLRSKGPRFKLQHPDFIVPPINHILIGAISTEYHHALVNGLSMGIDTKEARRLLNMQYDIGQTYQAKHSIECSLQESSNVFFQTVFYAFMQPTREQQHSVITNATDNELVAEKAFEYLLNLQQTFDSYKDQGYATNKVDLEGITVLAWDMNNVVFLSRLCYQAGYISELDATTYISSAYQKTAKYFDSWQQFGSSYLLGMNMILGEHHSNAKHYQIVHDLLHLPQSPWMSEELLPCK